jgi:hypothetical protein
MRAHIRVRIMKISALTVDRIFSGTNQPNPQVMDSTPSAARQSHAPIRRARGKELWFPHFQNDGSRAESVAKWKSDGVAEKLTELFEQARTAQRLGTELASSHPSGIPTAIFSLPTFGSGAQG